MSAPWARPRHEALLIALVALAALLPMQSFSVQDDSHFCLSRALVHGRLAIDDCIGSTLDRSRYGGHLYSNKAPGMSALAVPAVVVTGLPAPAHWTGPRDFRLWLTRLWVSGLPFVAVVFMLGRLAEGLRRGAGGIAIVAGGLGTLLGPFAIVGFDHLATAAFGLAAFALCWHRRPLAAGACAGAALLCEYEAAAVLLALGVLALTYGRGFALRYAAGALPGAVLLALYDWTAFGAPWHEPLRYSDNVYRAQHQQGLLGIHAPSAHSTYVVFLGTKGLVTTMPVLIAAAAGLALLRRREALVCGAVAAAFVVAECGYFDPYGGDSPGPRYLVAALPFLLVGLAPAYAAARRTVLVLAAVSVIAETLLELTWTRDPHYSATFWGDVAHAFVHGPHSELAGKVADTLVSAAGTGRLAGAVVVCAAAAASYVLAVARG